MWPGHIYSENDWNPTTLEQALTNGTWGYRASKTFAEKAAWEFLDREKPGFSLVTLNPPLVLGPIAPWLQTDIEHLNTSNQRFAALLTGKAKEQGNIPATGTPLFVDVRDLALAHVRALKIPEAGGKRFFITNGHFSNEEINDIIRDNFPEYADKLPSKGTKGGALPDGGYFSFDNTRSKEILKLEYTPLKSSVIDTVKSLQKIGA